jgi:hypothetical protein
MALQMVPPLPLPSLCSLTSLIGCHFDHDRAIPESWHAMMARMTMTMTVTIITVTMSRARSRSRDIFLATHPGARGVCQVHTQYDTGHGHGHGHGVFILATSSSRTPRRPWHLTCVLDWPGGASLPQDRWVLPVTKPLSGNTFRQYGRSTVLLSTPSRLGGWVVLIQK